MFEQYGFFYHLFCKFCEKPSLKAIWEKYPDKLAKERSVQNLMLKWDELGLSCMNIDILGCILPNIETHTMVISAKRFLLRLETYFNQVHELSTVSSFFETSRSCFFFNLTWLLNCIQFWFSKVFLLNKYLRFCFFSFFEIQGTFSYLLYL